jgi:SlyX protein
MPDSLESRLAELEIKLSYTDDLIETLNRAVFRQQEQIEHLQRGLRALREQQQAVAGENSRPDPRDETPPHY